MVLTRNMIETYGATILCAFRDQCHVESHPERRYYPRAVPIEQFATQYLKLDLIYTKLSDNGNVLGVTSYGDTNYKYSENGKEKTIPLTSNQVLLDSRLAPAYGGTLTGAGAGSPSPMSAPIRSCSGWTPLRSS